MSNSIIPIPDLTPVIKAAFWMLCLSVPLAIWKLVDIAIWLWHHTHIHFGAP
jgi:hypothetical protein